MEMRMFGYACVAYFPLFCVWMKAVLQIGNDVSSN